MQTLGEVQEIDGSGALPLPAVGESILFLDTNNAKKLTQIQNVGGVATIVAFTV